MKTSELLNLFRLETDDVAKPYLWSDEEFYAYLDEAQDVHLRLVGGIADRRSALTKVTYKTGDQFKKYDDRILRIKGAIDESNTKIRIQNLDSLESPYLDDDYGSVFDGGLDDGRTGNLKYLITDVNNNEMQLYPIPDHDGYVRLFVYRRALEPVTGSGSELEVPSYSHLNLLNWVKYKAYMKQDAETFDGARADKFKSAFTEGVLLARKEKDAREDRKRLMSYGGIPM